MYSTGLKVTGSTKKRNISAMLCGGCAGSIIGRGSVWAALLEEGVIVVGAIDTFSARLGTSNPEPNDGRLG